MSDRLEPLTDSPQMIECRCCPPGIVYVVARNLCTYPDCITGQIDASRDDDD